jgi:superfamily II DNA or RNA helicase
MTTTPVLRDYQLEAVVAIEKAEADGQHYCLASLPTGTGKTLIFVELIRRRGGRALVLAHRDELLGQAEAKLVAAGIAPGAIGWVKASRDECKAPIVLASMQTLARKPRRERLIAAQAEAGTFTTIVIDEAHHVPAVSYLGVLDAIEDAIGTDDKGPLVLGVTATPNRSGVDEVFGPPVFDRDLIDMIAQGWLADLRGRRVGIDLDLGGIRRSHGDYAEADLALALGNANAPRAVVDAWCEHG